jgi:peptide/nickel transport system substrate-binding protein
MVADAKIPFFRASWIADYADAENYLALFYSKNFSPNGSNYTHFSNEKFDLLYKKSRTIVNDSLRTELYKEMNKIVMEESAVIILYYDQVLRFSQKNIKNLGVNAMNLLNLKTVRKE